MGNVIEREIQDGIAWVTLNRPKSLNALNDQMAHALLETLTSIQASNAKVIVIQGAGDHFMAGGDVGFFHQTLAMGASEQKQEVAGLIEIVHRSIALIRELPQPVIAKVQGNCAGFGMSLVGVSDLAIAADNALFTQAYTQIGATPDGGNTYFIPRLIGNKRFMAMTLLNEPVNADDALAMGLVSRVASLGELDHQVQRMAIKLAKGPAQAYRNLKRLVNATSSNSLMEQLESEQESFVDCALGSDFAEGVSAFVEKRKAEFVRD